MIGWLPGPPGRAMSTLEVMRPRSADDLMPRSLIVLPVKAWIDSGTCWMFSLRFWAVTITSSTWVPGPLAAARARLGAASPIRAAKVVPASKARRMFLFDIV